MDTPYIQIGCVANVFTRLMHFKKAGDIEHGHTHPFDHASILAAGRLKMTVNGQTSEFTAPQIIWVGAELKHELVALEDNTVVMCVHALRTGDRVEDILDPAGIPKGVNPLTMSKPVAGDN